MDTKTIDWREYVNHEKFEKSIDDILRPHGYSVSLFNKGGEKFIWETLNELNQACPGGCKENTNSCNEHYLEVQKAIAGKNGNLSYCEKNKNKEMVLLHAPLMTSSGKNLGTLVACRKAEACHFQDKENEINFLKGITALLADKIYQDVEIKNLTEELNTKYEELSLLYEIGEKTQVNDSKDKSVEYIVNRAMETINPSAIVWSESEGNKNIIYRNPERNSNGKTIGEKTIREICSKTTRMISKAKEPLILNNLNKYREFAGIWSEAVNVLSIPLISDTKGFGSLNFIEDDPERIFLNDHLKLMEAIARSTVNLLKNSELYEKLQKLFFNVVRMLLGIIENKDTYTEGHSIRVYKISIQLAKLLKLSKKDVFDLEWAAILHDVGKITIPTEILQKPGKLTSEEFEIIKTHPAKGAELVSTIDEFKNAVKGIRYHHERIDGRGYPEGLTGDKTPLIAKIISVADTFDALNSARPYRARPSQEFVLAEIRQSASTQLDPMLVDILLNNYELFYKTVDEEMHELFEEADIKGLL